MLTRLAGQDLLDPTPPPALAFPLCIALFGFYTGPGDTWALDPRDSTVTTVNVYTAAPTPYLPCK